MKWNLALQHNSLVSSTELLLPIWMGLNYIELFNDSIYTEA